MITNIKLKNFKIHKLLDLCFSNLTVLAGYNSAGKSSVIQSMLLLRQNYLKGNVSTGLNLKGQLCDLGLCKDVLCGYAEDDILEIGIESNGMMKWSYDLNHTVALKSYAKCISAPDVVKDGINLFGKSFQYISVARWAPQESYPLDTMMVEEERQISKEKGCCELTPHFLHHYSKDAGSIIEVPKELRCKGCEDANLLSQVSAWEALISSGVSVNPLPTGTNFQLNFSYENNNGGVTESSAINVGSGLSFVLPVIVALLSTPCGGMVIVENPEAHLHPQAQAILASLIAKAAQYGVQVVVETHSDYIINGVLIACQKYEESEPAVGIDRNNVVIYQFLKDSNSHEVSCDQIRIGEGGTITNQPKGFFDQMEKDMNVLLKID